MTFLQAEGANPIVNFLPFIAVLAVFYFIMIRPQQNQQKKRREMLSTLEKGDKVITVGGIHGEIIAIDDEELSLKIADQVEIRMSRSGIGRSIEQD